MEHIRVRAFDVLIRSSWATSGPQAHSAEFVPVDVLSLRADVHVPSMADGSL